ncbi:response regulator transcription factor [Alkalicoccobacillus murimartini]|uniref:DNA-binding response OmpR family regulator n=1 Tax=Alkalicoccobacillus murimartini TaxID=171685 RepID=A0ABT9YM89_9BACI|nr:response regulator transcription factor [Alkalicoccobacillus murimartini]MDQ0208990.1 DNA-binding response OmpR family regulator [Alkalicoccobacillus murimartini]
MTDERKILIVEDEEKIARILKLELEYEGYQTESVHEGIKAWELLQNQSWALIILDVMLPGLSGMEVLRRMRDRGDLTPVIMLTARDTVVDKVSGLDQGANDYVTKPFEIEELLARIRANVRQNTLSKPEDNSLLLQSGDLEVHTASREVKRSGKEITLTAREYDLLVFLLHHPNQVLTRDQLLQQVWGFDYVGETNIVDVYIRYLRQKMDKDYDVKLLHTVRGAGYMLKVRNS